MKTRIVIGASYHVFIELAKSIEYTLRNNFNFTDVVISDLDITSGPAMDKFRDENSELTFILMALKKFVPQFKGRKILFQTEELWNRRDKGSYFGLYANHYDRVLEMYDENVHLRGTPNVVYCPVGYSPVWETDLPDVEEDIDVMFHGSVTPRREEFFRMFRLMGLKCWYTGGTHQGQVFGIKRNELIKRSKIDINIKAHNNWSYGPMHCLPAQANKQFMLAEKANGGYGPFKPGLHVAEYDGMADCKEKVLYWLNHEKERKQFAINAYNDMVKTCDFSKILANALGIITEKTTNPRKPRMKAIINKPGER